MIRITADSQIPEIENSLAEFLQADYSIDYFDSNGKSATKALMKTPINGARLSSAYGMRKHPILGYNRLHQGVDFAAPTLCTRNELTFLAALLFDI